ncbi:hypothetical protein D8B29_04170 [Verminephrobacter eiseniae]|nr:hypothetical protein [Verminephrobacter eiseniae]MCW5286508.1 hypothetical protein [Verminephrobacter eiseniae]MCW5304808.1 hypothetical protein [Verminephrobacter eiseniae]MCW8178849.1 hypothetical protein [Verminephrobacter eiseniae]MCW8191041.1 hypothetical protein [Verminephrobacter eiseniae]
MGWAHCRVLWGRSGSQAFRPLRHGGREWRGFHHHAGPGIAAYGFLMAQRLHSGCCRQNPVPRTARRAPGWGVRAPAIAGLEHGPGKNGC